MFSEKTLTNTHIKAEVAMGIYHKKYFLPLLLFLMFIAPASAFSEPVGTLTRVEGSVDILKLTETVPVNANTGDPVFTGDIIRTKRSGKAEIRFHDDSVIQLAPESRIKVDDYAVGQDNVRKTGLLSLFRGKIRALVSKTRGIMQAKGGTDSNFSIKTRTAIAGVKGTGLIVFYERGVTGVIFTEGHGFVYNPAIPDRIIPVNRGQATFVLSSDTPPAAARTVSANQLAVHVEATTVADKTSSDGEPAKSSDGTPGVAPSGGAEAESAPTAMALNVVAENMSIPALINQSADMPLPVPAIRAAVSPVLQFANQPPVIPITETDPSLIVTPVTVKVTIPQ